jgi:hypothetical protein
MGFKITRQRYFDDNQLAVEICSGIKLIGKDVLNTRYKDLGESKYLVSPVDAVGCGIKIMKKWNLDYYDEIKKLAFVNADGTGIKEYFEANDKDIKRLEKLAKDILNKMSKCGACNRALSQNFDAFVIDEIPNVEFCDEQCGSRKYRERFGIEMPKPKKAARK